jgi:hypothetical protein
MKVGLRYGRFLVPRRQKKLSSCIQSNGTAPFIRQRHGELYPDSTDASREKRESDAERERCGASGREHRCRERSGREHLRAAVGMGDSGGYVISVDVERISLGAKMR